LSASVADQRAPNERRQRSLYLPHGALRGRTAGPRSFELTISTHSGQPSWLKAALQLNARKLKTVTPNSFPLSLLQKELCTGDFLRREAKVEGAGGHFWHDAVTKPNIITPAP